MHLLEAQRLPVTHCFYATPGFIAEPISHLEMEPSGKGVGFGGRTDNAAMLGPNQQTGKREEVGLVELKWERGRRVQENPGWLSGLEWRQLDTFIKKGYRPFGSKHSQPRNHPEEGERSSVLPWTKG